MYSSIGNVHAPVSAHPVETVLRKHKFLGSTFVNFFVKILITKEHFVNNLFGLLVCLSYYKKYMHIYMKRFRDSFFLTTIVDHVFFCLKFQTVSLILDVF